MANVIAAIGTKPVGKNTGKRRRVIGGCLTLLLVVPLLLAWCMLPGQVSQVVREPTYIPAVFVSFWRLETLHQLTLKQRFPWRYTLKLGREGPDLAIRFLPRQPNELEDTGTDMPRRAWETVVVVNPHTMSVVKWRFAAD